MVQILDNITKALGGKGTKRRRLPELADPDNVSFQLSGKDLKNPPTPDPSARESAFVGLVQQKYSEASSARLMIERDWLTDIAHENGDVWTETHIHSGDVQSLIDEDDPYRTYFPGNFVEPRTAKLKAKATSSQPISKLVPRTPLPQDVGAAAEARDIEKHYDVLMDRQVQTQDWADCAIGTGQGFLKLIWNKNRTALTSYVDSEQDPDYVPPTPPAPGQQPNPIDAIDSLLPKLNGKVVVKDAPVGDIEEIIVPAFEIYPEPHARCWNEVSWLVHAKVRTLEYIRDHYGERGWMVSADKDTSASSRWETKLDAIYGDPVRTNLQADSNVATVYELWVKPTERYPRGLLLPVAGGILLVEPDATNADNYDPDEEEPTFRACDWPYEKNDIFPFVPLFYRSKWGTVWSTSAVRPMVGAQREINNIISRACDNINTWKPSILVPMGGSVKTDAFQSRRSYQFVTYDDNKPPTYIASPVFPAEAFEMVEMLKGYMDDCIGTHDPTSGMAPTPDASGKMVVELKESDESLHAQFYSNIEKAAKQRLEWEIALCAQFYNEPRLVGISQEGSVDIATANARSFEHLTGGGKCRVEIVPGSAIPKSPDAERQFWLGLLTSGGFTEQMFPALLAVIDRLGLDDSDVLVNRVKQAISEVIAMTKAMNPDPAAAQAAAMQTAMAMKNADLQGQIALKNLDIHGKMALQEQQVNADAAQTTQKLNAAVAQRTAETAEIKDENEHNAALQMMQNAHAASVPITKITVAAGPEGTVGAEMLAGYPRIDDPAQLAAQDAAKAAQNPGGNSNGNEPQSS